MSPRGLIALVSVLGCAGEIDLSELTTLLQEAAAYTIQCVDADKVAGGVEPIEFGAGCARKVDAGVSAVAQQKAMG